MPLQWLPLQQRQQQQRQSPISQALRPQAKQPQRQFLGTMDTSNRFVEEQKAKWAEEDKLKKLERDEQTNKAQELGMRMGKAIQGQQQGTAAQAEQQAIAKEKVEADPESAAKEMYNLMLTLPDEAKNQLLNQIFTPTAPSGTITSAGKLPVNMPEKYNPIAGVFLEKGWAMFDAKGNINLSEPERGFEKGTFKEMENGDILNEATGEIIPRGDIPAGVDTEVIADAYNYGSTYMGRLTEPTLLERITPENMAAFMDNARAESKLATENYLLGQGVSKKEAKDIAYSIPIGERGKTEEPIIKTGRDAPLDEEKAKGFADYLELNPDIDIEAYRDRDGDATIDRGLEILSKRKKPEKEIKPKKTETKGGLITSPSGFKSTEPLKGMPNLLYYP